MNVCITTKHVKRRARESLNLFQVKSKITGAPGCQYQMHVLVLSLFFFPVVQLSVIMF